MGRSVSYPDNAIVAFTVLEFKDDDASEHDLEFESGMAARGPQDPRRNGFSNARHPRWLARPRGPDPPVRASSLTSMSRAIVAWLRSGSPNAMTMPIGTLNGVTRAAHGRSAGLARLRCASVRWSATKTASGTCQTGRASTAGEPPQTVAPAA